MLSNGLSKWIYTKLSVNWIKLCRQSKSLDHSHQWLFASASFLYNKFSQYINAGIKKTIKKHCFNEGEIETTGGSAFLPGFMIFEFQRAKTFGPKLCNSKKTRYPWGYLGLVRRQFKQRRHISKNYQLYYIKKQILQMSGGLEECTLQVQFLSLWRFPQLSGQ